jgi:hypothetical protein
MNAFSPITVTTMDRALAWAARGFPVFPLGINGTKPLPGSNGHLSATTDPDRIREMWSDYTTGSPVEYNIGCSPRDGRHAIVDLDTKNGRNGIENYKALGGEIGGLVVRSKSGGLHVYLTADNLPTTAGTVGDGIDTRGPDGYVVAPGSTVDGAAYEIIQDDPMLPAPAWLIEKLGERRDRTRVSSTYSVEDDLPANVERFADVCRRAEPACGGVWHAASRDLACEAVRLAVSPDAAIAVMLEHWVPRGTGFEEEGRDERWAADVEASYAWALGFGEHGMSAMPAQTAFDSLKIVLPPPDAAPPATGSRLRLLSMADCRDAPRRRYVVKGLLAAGDVALIIGPPGTGKSCVAPLIAHAVAVGREVFGHRTRCGRVFYVPAEDRAGMMGRVAALGTTHGDSNRLKVVDGVFDLLSAGGQSGDLLALVRAEQPALIILDTLAAAFPGLRENESEDMGAVVQFARALATAEDGTPGAAVLLLHHMPKSGTTPRGHGSLNGAADVVLVLDRDAESGIVRLSLGKNRNGPSVGETMAFRIESVAIGTDEDGDAITAPLAVETDAAENSRSDKLTDTEQRALEILAEVLAAGGPDVVSGQTWTGYGLPLSDKIGVNEDEWREACEARNLSSAPLKKSRTAKFRRTMQSLTTKGAIKSLFGVVWMDVDEVK